MILPWIYLLKFTFCDFRKNTGQEFWIQFYFEHSDLKQTYDDMEHSNKQETVIDINTEMYERNSKAVLAPILVYWKQRK